ncbi:hypothetical protein [Pseudomonas sp. Marseille-P9655]|uniref:tail fiber/spike domain-containing protein n=1 Tax=Pseudomonas sp. Marseille-P9655 TaxID=2866591 RepID=UPI001CE46251|nr:hypothetical protein [Pseudomonas sp. Marseille-P9655]
MALTNLTRGSHNTADFEKPIYKKRTDFFFGATLAANDEVLLWSADRGGDGNFYAWRGAFPKVVAANMSPATSGGLGPNAWVSVGDASVGRLYATPMMFGALGGNADDKLALQRCIDFCQATGAEMRLDRKHRTSGTLVITSAMKMTGTLGASAIEGTFAAGDVLQVTVTTGPFNGGLTMNGVEVLSSVTKTSGYLINLIGSYNNILDQIILTNGYNGIGITGAPSQTTRVTNLVSANHSNYHIDVQNVSADVVFDSCYLHGQASNNQSTAGANIRQAGDVTLRAVNTAWCGTDVLITPSSGQRVQALHLEGCFLDSATGYGVYAQPTGTGKIDLLKLSDVWCCTHNQGGVLLGGSTGAINKAELIGCTVSNNLLNGLFINTGATNVTVIGGSYSANANNGIAVAGGVSNFKIIGATCGPAGEFGANGQWGILIADGAGQDFIVTGNQLKDNPLGGLYDGATGPYRQTGSNLGGTGPLKSYVNPAAYWDVDLASKGATPIGAGGVLILPAGGGIVTLVDDSSGNFGLFFASGGTVTKIAGSADFVAGAAGASQIGLSYSAGNYQVGNGYAGTKNICIGTIRIKVAS